MKHSIDLTYNLLGKDSVSKGLNIDKHDIVYVDNIVGSKDEIIYFFHVNSQSTYYNYDVSIVKSKGKISSFYCECEQFKDRHTCKHVAACLIYYGDIVLGYKNDNIEISNDILGIFAEDTSGGVKERVNVDFSLNFNGNVPTFKLLVGTSKMYTINRESRFASFMYSVLNNDEYEFGINFTYNPSIHFISDDDMKLLIFLFGYFKDRGYYYRYNPFELSDRELYSLFEILKDRNFNIDNVGVVHGISYDFPTMFLLDKESDCYRLSIDDFDNYRFFDNSFKYCVYSGKLHVIPNSYSVLLASMGNNGIDSLSIDHKHVESFKKGLLGKIKNNIVISDDITDIVFFEIVVESYQVETYFLGNDVQCRATCESWVHIHHASIKTVAGIGCNATLGLEVIVAMVPVTKRHKVGMCELAAFGHTSRTARIEQDK